MTAAARNGKRHWLAAELKALGETDQSLAALPKADTHLHVHLQTEAKRFGVAYVLEESTHLSSLDDDVFTSDKLVRGMPDLPMAPSCGVLAIRCFSRSQRVRLAVSR